MQLTVLRKWFTNVSTCGTLSIDGDDFWATQAYPPDGPRITCYTLERQLYREGMEKPYAVTEDTYEVQLLPSDHFQMTVPHVIGVPGFTAIEMHPANWPSDLRGCTGVGCEHQEENRDPKTGIHGGAVFGSKVMFAALMEKLKTATDKIVVTYTSQGATS